MLFTSYSFIIFLVLLFATYYLIPKKYQWILLLFASYTFYFFAGSKYILYILFTTISTYIISRKIGSLHNKKSTYLKENKGKLSRQEKKEYKASIKSIQWKWLVLCLLLNFGILAIVKYSNFTIANINYVLGSFGSKTTLSFWDIALPMGISFYTFQTMGYIIDVYRGKYTYEKNFFKLALFVSFFPQLVQGPINRFDDLSKTLFEKHSFDSRNISFGLQRIMWGYFKKLVIADRILVAVNILVRNPGEYQGVFVFVGMMFYALQLYADFTGGIDITIGIAEVMGIKIKENFIRPYFSKSIAEFWRRWHITLGTWFKEYMFYPISVCKPMLKLSKTCRKRFGDAIGKRVTVYIATIVVWFTTGLWHGSSWNFIVWGLMNCFFILVSQELSPLYDRFHNRYNVKHTVSFRLFQVVRTVLLMSSIRMFDCYRDVPTTFRMFGTMFTKWNFNELFNGSLMELGLSLADYYILLIGVIILVAVSLIQRKGSIRCMLAEKPQPIRYVVNYAMFYAIVIFGAYGIGYDSSQFIYNQF
ncbi:MAG: MBOAT family O-acyltransferase [Eubacteriales bacterium]